MSNDDDGDTSDVLGINASTHFRRSTLLHKYAYCWPLFVHPGGNATQRNVHMHHQNISKEVVFVRVKRGLLVRRGRGLQFHSKLPFNDQKVLRGEESHAYS